MKKILSILTAIGMLFRKSLIRLWNSELGGIIDSLASFCFKSSFTSTGYSTDKTTGGTYGTGYIDLGAMDVFKDDGAALVMVGEPIYVAALVTTTLNDANTPRQYTVTVTLETADDAAFDSNLTTVMTLGVFAAGAVAGTGLVAPLPPGVAYRRYLRAKFTLSGTLTGGAFSCFLAKDVQLGSIYPSRISVS